jgi:hypothetical protein
LKRLTRTVALVLCLAVLPACNLMNPKQATLTDQQVVMYIKAYKNIRKKVPHLAEELRQHEDGVQAGQAGFDVIEKAIKEAGFKDYPEFVRVNAAVAFAFSQGQGKAFMGDMSEAHKKAYAEIDSKLKDPNVPAAVKEQLKMARQQIEDNYKKNEGWANVSMEITSKLTDKESIAVVMKHRKELEAAFTAR